MTRRVAVFGLGGTIVMGAPTGQSGVRPSLTAAHLVASVPGLAALGVELVARDVRSLPSASLTFADLRALGAEIAAAVADGVDGVVVTQGTDTLEETAYALDLTYRGDQPVVLTGAMRNPTLPGADGPANLFAAVVTALDPGARGRGVLVAFADEIHAAARVRKAHTSSVTAFTSPVGGPLGQVVEGRPRWLNRSGRRTLVPPSTQDVRVGLVVAALGDDGWQLPLLAERCDGLVVAAFGAGHVPQTWVPTLSELAARMPVVLASRAGAGPVLTHTYGYPGSEQDLLGRGLIGAGFLDPYKARVLLGLALAAGADRDQLAAAFAVAGGGDIAAGGDIAGDVAWPW